MPIDFPSSPTLNQTYTYSGRTWRWNSEGWALMTDAIVKTGDIEDGTIVNADISATAAIADTKLATISTAGKVANSATTATNTNTASAIVARDASGNFTASTITANLSGTASNASAVPWLGVSGTPTTLSGYGITDSATSTHVHGNISNAGAIGTTANLPVITGTSGVLQTGSFGTAAATFCEGNDSRLSNARTPTDGSVTNVKVAADAAIAGSKITPNFSDKTDAVFLASGTTAQRPTGANGQVRYNTTLGCLESFIQGTWQVIANTTLDYGLITSAADTTFDYGALV